MNKNLPNSSRHFRKRKSVFLQILHHSSVPWDILFQLKFYILSTKGSYQSTNLVKFHLSSRKSELLHFGGLPSCKSYKAVAKKVQKTHLLWHWRMMQSLKRNWLVVSNMIWKILWIFTQPLKRPKISLGWAIFVESIDPVQKRMTFFFTAYFQNLIFHEILWLTSRKKYCTSEVD